ncbi:MAG: xanthine dehydrogenase molybdopterin binding subunit [Roseofilum sp. SID1]|uniref:xanthine dehydrogenase molybdopterin binding subunit n=1 Tax=Roseofilum sp. SID1 TaxID=2821497 RepID=UPI001B2C62EA|nr:xanthine dehydrogenase molybdopterin binding subunit [Roseofilum sp. SID1]MBP0039071.1 xanthine dehydrogenase molybdopterin binding subunit [Roseofilum sp. SID1]
MKFNKHTTHESVPHHVTGTATYTDDLRPTIDLLHLYPVLSSHARAKINQIDYSLAQQFPGVVTVITPEDITGINNTGIVSLDEILLPTNEIYYHSQPIIWIVAETEAAARDGAKQVTIDYTPLEPILTIQQAIEANSFQGEPQIIQRGNSHLALEKAEYTLEGELEIGGQDHFYLETHVSWVTPDAEGNYQVYSSTQHPTETQIMVARVLGIPRSQVVVTCLRMGGAFGGKESQSNPIAAIAALAAQKTGQSVRVRLKRNHDMIVTGKRHGFLGKYRVGFNLEGKISALDVDLYSHGGWSLDLSLPIMGRALFHIDNCYYIPHLEVRGNVAKTHTVSNTAFRGFGGPQAMVIIEDVIDRISRFLKLTPLEIREKNFYHGTGETNTTHYGQELFDNRLHQIWSQLKQESQLEQRMAQMREFNQSHAYEKRGLAITPVKFGISFTKSEYNQAGALILIYLDGSIQLNHGGTEMGQGLHSKMLQVAAKSLGVNIDRFRVMPTSTDKVPNTSATAASSGSDLNGQAIKNACETLKERLAPVAAKLLDLYAPEDLVFADDWIYSATNPNLKVGFDEVIGQAYLERISLSATGYYRTPNISWNPQTGKGRPFHYYAYGAAVSEVQVDRFTGTFKLRQVDIVHDVGNSLHPLVDRGQIEGGFVQGMGWLTMEELVWDNRGELCTYSPSTYKIPTVADIPENFHISLLEKAEQPGVIYGSKAVGEPPFMLAISVREAIRESIAAFGDTQQVKLASPATPEAILRAIEILD